MGQNYLNGKNSSQINAFLAATGWNLKKMMKKLKLELEKIFTYLKFHFLSKIMYLNFDLIRSDYITFCGWEKNFTFSHISKIVKIFNFDFGLIFFGISFRDYKTKQNLTCVNAMQSRSRWGF